MPHPPVTIPIAFVRGMMSGVGTRDRDSDALLREAGIAPELLNEPGARIAAAQYVALFRLLIERFDDECLGFLSRPLRRGSFALMTRAAITAPTLDRALRHIAHVLRLLQDDVMLVHVAEGTRSGVALRFEREAIGQRPFLHELLLRTFWRLLAWVAGGTLPVVGFDFAFERPAHAGDYAKVFPATLHFGAGRSAFWFEAARLEQPVRRDATELHAFLAEAQAQIIAPRTGDDLCSTRVRHHLQSTRPAWPDLTGTAQALHMSAATLQRHLAKEGTSFQALKDGLRRDDAIARLNTRALPLAALASELGFADSAAFQRAFKGWTGSPPGRYRRKR